MVSAGPRPGRRQRRLGQNFLTDPNLLDAIVRDAALPEGCTVLEVGGGGGALTERLAAASGHVHVIELDERMRPELEPLARRRGNLSLVWGDALSVDLASLRPEPERMVSNLPYSVAVPVLLRTLAELPRVEEWLVMVQREIADRLRADPGTREYGGPAVIVRLSCEVELVRPVGRRVFSPPPQVDSALLRLRRTGPAAASPVRTLVRAAFSHRRKTLARSLELASGRAPGAVRAALAELGLPERARAEALAPEDFVSLAEKLDG